jgi:hypothetical protein
MDDGDRLEPLDFLVCGLGTEGIRFKDAWVATVSVFPSDGVVRLRFGEVPYSADQPPSGLSTILPTRGPAVYLSTTVMSNEYRSGR